MSADDVRNTILDDNNAYFYQFNMDNYQEAINMFEILMGEEVAERKEFIFDNVDFSELIE